MPQPVAAAIAETHAHGLGWDALDNRIWLSGHDAAPRGLRAMTYNLQVTSPTVTRTYPVSKRRTGCKLDSRYVTGSTRPIGRVRDSGFYFESL